MNPLLASYHQVVSVTVEYEKNGKRVRKEFVGASAVAASRRFYAAKMKDGCEPRVVGGRRHGEVLADAAK